jgi:serine/threonine protein kinase
VVTAFIDPDTVSASLDDAPPPERIGPYRLGELLGQGGMGRVYRAERADGVFEQTIAIKLMRRTRMPLHVAEQFARERQILARLQHRNIAHLYDGGATPEGLSYFVMELVEGRPISQFAAEERLALQPMLMLFRQVCAAVQYAHARLVVHADIKPNNIIVTRDGTAKLLDFGLARVIHDVGDPTAAPAGSLGITQFYASPARRRGETPSTIDDVYSLGVLLRELLKGYRSVPPELRSICNRAAADDPAARYASVDALEEDVEHWLSGLPVQAHGTAWSYIALKFLARHRFVVSSAAVVILMLAGAATALAVLYVRAERAKTQAEQRFNDVRALSRFVLFDVYDRLESVPRALTLRRDIAAKGQQYLDDLAKVPDAPLEVRLEVIEGLRRLAQVQSAPGSASLAQASVARANLARAEAIARALPEDSKWARERALALTRIFIARARLSMGMELNLEATRRSLEDAQRTLGPLLAAGTGDAVGGAGLRASPDAEATGLSLDLAVGGAARLEWVGELP